MTTYYFFRSRGLAPYVEVLGTVGAVPIFFSCAASEVTPNAANIYQYQEPPDADLEEWIAVAGGGFTKPLDVTMCQMKLSCTTPPPAGAAHVTSPKRKRGEMQNGGAAFFDTSNRCTNTHCTYPPGHDGLCSHMKVAGRRTSRSAVRAAA